MRRAPKCGTSYYESQRPRRAPRRRQYDGSRRPRRTLVDRFSRARRQRQVRQWTLFGSLNVDEPLYATLGAVLRVLGIHKNISWPPLRPVVKVFPCGLGVLGDPSYASAVFWQNPGGLSATRRDPSLITHHSSPDFLCPSPPASPPLPTPA